MRVDIQRSEKLSVNGGFNVSAKTIDPDEPAQFSQTDTG